MILGRFAGAILLAMLVASRAATRARMTAMTLGFALALSSAALAQDDDAPPPPPPAPQPGDHIPFCGKVEPLVESGCIGIVGRDTTLELTAVTPAPTVGTTIAGTATVGDEANKCLQGVHAESATWSAVASCTGQ